MERRVPQIVAVIVADPDPLARDALIDIVGGVRDTTIIGARDRQELLDLVASDRPDVILADEGLLAPDGFALLPEIHERFAAVTVVMVTNGTEAADPLEALRAGVDSIVPKACPPEEICEAVRSVLMGRAIVRPRVAMALIRQLRHAPTSGRGFRPIHSDLTNREWEILDLLVSGASTAQIADRLVLSQDTVYTHIKNILRKMHVRSRAEAIEAATRLYGLRTGTVRTSGARPAAADPSRARPTRPAPGSSRSSSPSAADRS
jgi:DNA-binding NarL/FixJ family response regulator